MEARLRNIVALRAIPYSFLAKVSGKRLEIVHKYAGPRHYKAALVNVCSLTAALSFLIHQYGRIDTRKPIEKMVMIIIPLPLLLTVRIYCKQNKITEESFYRDAMAFVVTEIRHTILLEYTRPLDIPKGAKKVLKRMPAYLWYSARVIAHACSCNPSNVFAWAAALYLAQKEESTDVKTLQ